MSSASTVRIATKDYELTATNKGQSIYTQMFVFGQQLNQYKYFDGTLISPSKVQPQRQINSIFQAFSGQASYKVDIALGVIYLNYSSSKQAQAKYIRLTYPLNQKNVSSQKILECQLRQQKRQFQQLERKQTQQISKANNKINYMKQQMKKQGLKINQLTNRNDDDDEVIQIKKKGESTKKIKVDQKGGNSKPKYNKTENKIKKTEQSKFQNTISQKNNQNQIKAKKNPQHQVQMINNKQKKQENKSKNHQKDHDKSLKKQKEQLKEQDNLCIISRQNFYQSVSQTKNQKQKKQEKENNLKLNDVSKKIEKNEQEKKNYDKPKTKQNKQQNFVPKLSQIQKKNSSNQQKIVIQRNENAVLISYNGKRNIPYKNINQYIPNPPEGGFVQEKWMGLMQNVDNFDFFENYTKYMSIGKWRQIVLNEKLSDFSPNFAVKISKSKNFNIMVGVITRKRVFRMTSIQKDGAISYRGSDGCITDGIKSIPGGRPFKKNAVVRVTVNRYQKIIIWAVNQVVYAQHQLNHLQKQELYPYIEMFDQGDIIEIVKQVSKQK